MRLYTEEIVSLTPILFVGKKKSPWALALEKTLKQYNFEPFTSTALPDRLDRWANMIIFDDEEMINTAISLKKITAKILIVITNNKKELKRITTVISHNRLKHIKVVNIDTNTKSVDSAIIEKILWFLLSHSQEISLDLQKTLHKKHIPKIINLSLPKINKRKIFVIVLFILMSIELFFFAPLAGAALLLYQSGANIAKYNIVRSELYLHLANPLIAVANQSYQLSRPIISFFYLALLTDDLMLMENTSYALLQTATDTAANAQQIAGLMLQADKDINQQNELAERIKKIKIQNQSLLETTSILTNKIANYQNALSIPILNKLQVASVELKQTQKFLNHIDELIGGNIEKKYLLLFENNMEIRPGGGFIGSYALATFANYSLKELKVEDVYESDGQLKEHIDPPLPIKTYLNQPHWFLRDSNFSPDFPRNFQTAVFFLEKERGISNLHGGLAITTTAISNLLASVSQIYLPDYQETITADNFYIKTQLQVESDFFPGSKQKKNFLSSVVMALLNKLKTAPIPAITAAIKKSLDEKHIVIYVNNETIQKDIEILGYSGKIYPSTCTKIPCITESIFPVDANLGVNKANFFVKRLMTLKIAIDGTGTIEHVFTESFNNESPDTLFPGGSYKNYLQIYLAKDAIIRDLTVSGEPTHYDEIIINQFKVIGVFIEIPPRQTKQVKLTFLSENKIPAGETNYELIVQKQIGALNSDFVLQLSAHPSITINSQNFSTLANRGFLIYNTSLSNDRIFLMKVIKK